MSNFPLRSTSDELRWQAVVSRNRVHDGSFVYAVRTTGVYCRPSCPSRRSKRENTEFFSTPTEANGAGYRPCRRCRPDESSTAPRNAHVVRAACSLIETADRVPELGDLAARVGLSPSHLRREFKRLTGVTPREYAAGRRVARLQERLNAGAAVADAIYDAGYGSGSRVYESARDLLGMTPGQYRGGAEGVSIEFTISDSPLGKLMVAATGEGICCIELGDDAESLRDRLAERFPAAEVSENRGALRAAVEAITSFLEMPRAGLTLPLDIQGTAFQRRVWKALQAVAPGQTISYADLAASIGKPRAHRAVANACAANKLALAVPCHRVVRTDGQLGGYRWGLERKRWLLEKERASSERGAACSEAD